MLGRIRELVEPVFGCKGHHLGWIESPAFVGFGQRLLVGQQEAVLEAGAHGVDHHSLPQQAADLALG